MRRLLARLLPARRGSEHYCACGTPLERFWFAGPYGHLSRCSAEEARVVARDEAIRTGRDPEHAQFHAVRGATRRRLGGVETFWDVLHSEWTALADVPGEPGKTLLVTVQHGTRQDAWDALMKAIAAQPLREPGS